jgi:hypothetical protein
MVWLVWVFPIFSGAVDAASRGAIKMTKVHRYTLVAGGYLFALPFYLIWLAIEGIPEVKPAFWLAVAVHVPLLVWANVWLVRAHRESPLILTMPVQGFTSAFLLGTAPIMGGGSPTWLGGLGVLILTLGLYVLNIQSSRLSFWEPLKAIKRESGVRLMLGVAIIFSVTANLDYVAFQNSNAPFYLLIDHGLAGLLMAGMAAGLPLFSKKISDPVSPSGSWKGLALYGVFVALSVVFHLLAFRWIPMVPYVIAGKRAGGIFFAILLGLAMAFIVKHKDFLKEREDLKYRLPGAAIMVLGMIIIIFWGRA